MKDIIVMTKKENENASSLYRRFVKHFRSSGVQKTAKRHRFFARKPSKNIRQQDCINRLKKQQEYEVAYRLGKITTTHKHGGRG